ncbi:MAG: hypothetical protein KDD67_18035 [Ignavibacteriae bacterium]|nr:hypothetical protein [Ignavibacteriota bacterium]MCB9214586.1 hypothetical protein [Ignavibacteria bacterium]
MLSTKRKQGSFWQPLFATLGVVGVLYLIAIIVISNFIPGSWEERGTIGDSFGIVNSVFTALAFAAVVVSLWYQRKELQSTLEEVQASERSHSESLRAQEKAIEALKEQTVALYRPYIVARMEIRESAKFSLIIENTGRTAAKKLRLQTDLDFVYPGGFGYKVQSDQGKLSEAYAFNNEIDTFAPGQKLFYHIAIGGYIREEDPDFQNHSPRFTIEAIYSFDGDERTKEVTVIDLRTFYDGFVDELRSDKALENISKHIESIDQTLKSKLAKL